MMMPNISNKEFWKRHLREGKYPVIRFCVSAELEKRYIRDIEQRKQWARDILKTKQETTKKNR